MPSAGKLCPHRVHTAPAMGKLLALTTSPLNSSVWGRADAATAKLARAKVAHKNGAIEAVLLPGMSGQMRSLTPVIVSQAERGRSGVRQLAAAQQFMGSLPLYSREGAAA